MRFCLDKQIVGGYDYSVPTFYTDKHLGIDWQGKYVPVYAPEDGLIVKVITTPNGGNTIWFKPTGKSIILRWLHLDEFKVKQGDYVKEGAVVAITGNTGLSTAPHLHEDFWPKGDVTYQFKDTANPRDYYKLNKTFMKVTIVANNIAWDYQSAIPILTDWFKTYSNNKLEIVFDTKDTNITGIPFAPFINGLKAIDINWYRNNITPLATGELTVFLLNPEDYQTGGPWGWMTYGDASKPVRTEVSTRNVPDWETAPLVVHRIFHEVCHALYFLTGQPDRVHELLEKPEPQQTLNRSILLNEIDYPKLQAKLLTIKPMPQNQAKVVKSKTSNTIFICYPVPDMDYLQKKANLEGFVVPNPVPNTDTLV